MTFYTARGFDEEAMPIEQIDTALGEVVISGMIRKVEEREIRNERTNYDV